MSFFLAFICLLIKKDSRGGNPKDEREHVCDCWRGFSDLAGRSKYPDQREHRYVANGHLNAVYRVFGSFRDPVVYTRYQTGWLSDGKATVLGRGSLRGHNNIQQHHGNSTDRGNAHGRYLDDRAAVLDLFDRQQRLVWCNSAKNEAASVPWYCHDDRRCGDTEAIGRKKGASPLSEWQDHELVEQYLRAHNIDTVWNEQIKPHISLYDFELGELICSQGESAAMLYVLVRGKVKVYTTSVEGKTLILSFKTPLELIGDIEYVRGTDIVNTVEAVSPVLMLGVPYRYLKKYGKSDPALLQFLLDHITMKFYAKSHSLSFNLLYPVEVRMASYLLSVSFDEADTMLEKKLSTADLMDAASLLGTSYRHFNRVLQQFCASGLVERKNGFLLVKDHQGLRELAGQNIYE